MEECSVWSCPTGKASLPSDENIHFFHFPLKNESLLKDWLQSITQPGWKPTESSQICSLHFQDGDFKSKKGKRQNQFALKPDAVPTIFKRAPENLLKKPLTPEARRRSEIVKAERQLRELMELDVLKDLDDLEKRLDTRGLQDNWTHLRSDEDTLLLNLVEVNAQLIPAILASIAIDQNLRFTLSYQGRPLSRVQFLGLAPGQKLERLSQIRNLMTAVKGWSGGEKNKHWLSMAEECLEKFLVEEGGVEEVVAKKVAFLHQQLQMATDNQDAPRHSQDLLLFAYSLYTANPEAYRALLATDVMALPSEGSLEQLLSGMGVVPLDNELLLSRVAEMCSREDADEDSAMSMDQLYGD